MTQLEQGTPLQRFIRNRANPVPGVPIQGSIATPGTVVLPPTSRAVTQAAQIRQLLGAVGTTANQAAQVARSIAVEKEREAAGEEIFDKARASSDARMRLALDRDIVADHANAVPVGEDGLEDPEAVAQYVRDYLDTITEGQSDAYRHQYESIFASAFTADILKYNDGVQDQARLDLLKLNAGHGAGAKSADELNAVYDQTRALEIMGPLSDTQLAEAIYLTAINSAAEAGDEGRFPEFVEAAEKRFPDLFSTQITRAREVFKREVDEANREREEVARNKIAELATKAIRGEGTFDSVFDEIDASEDLDAETKRQLILRTNSDRRSANANILEAAIKEDLNRQKENVLDKLGIYAENATATGGLINAETITLTLLDGTTVEYDRTEQIETKVGRAWERIDTEIEDFVDNWTAKFRYLATNGKVAYEPLRRKQSGGAAQITSDMKEVPPFLEEQYQIWLIGQAVSEQTSNVNIDEAGKDYFRGIKLLMEELDMDFERAAMSAARTIDISTNLKDTLVEDFAHRAAPKAKNSRQVEAIIRTRAQAYIRQSGIDEKTALKYATRDFKEDYTMVNGFAVITEGRELPPNLPQIAEFVIGFYAKKNGIDPDRLTIRSLDDLTWAIGNVDGVPTGPFHITDAELRLISQQIFDKEAFEEKQRSLAEQIDVNAQHRNRVAFQAIMQSQIARGHLPAFEPLGERGRATEPLNITNVQGDISTGVFAPEPTVTRREEPDLSLVGQIVTFARRPKIKSKRPSRSRAKSERFQFN